MTKFTKAFASKYIDKLLKKHKISIYAKSATSSGRAKIKAKQIKIPDPVSIDRFCVCLHEIAHIIHRKGSKSFQKEFYCDKYALDTIAELGFDSIKWVQRMKWHSLAMIAKAHNRGLNHSAITPDIREFFKDVDFNSWIGNKVFVGRKYYDSSNPKDIELTVSMSKNDVETYLNRKGLMLSKSQSDDSTYNMWIVLSNGDRFGSTFSNLSDIVRAYELNTL